VIDRSPPSIGLPTLIRPHYRWLFFLYRIRPAWFLPRTICSWCGQEIAPSGLFSRHQTSHGVCAECSRRALEESRAARRIRSLAAVVFFAAFCCSSCSTKTEESTVAWTNQPYRPQRHEAIALPAPQRPSLEIQP
jgi:hypothetical protein